MARRPTVGIQSAPDPVRRRACAEPVATNLYLLRTHSSTPATFSPPEGNQQMTRTRTMLLTAAAFVMVLSACGNPSTTDTSAPASANAFVLNEWSVTPPTAPLQAGKMEITATNNGSETHELVLIRASDAASLPTNSDGSVDEAMIADADKAGEIPELAAGKSATKTLDLPAGHYVAICNLVDQMGQGNGNMGGNMGNGSGLGHVHYHLGMVTQFTVT